MPSVFSKLLDCFRDWSFRYNCYETVHPWTPFCSDCALDIGTIVFAEAIKLYTPLYLFGQLTQKRLDFESFQRTGQSILRSTSFISTNAFLALFFLCSIGHVTGSFNYYLAAYMPGFLSSSLAVLIEKPHRRSTLAFYVANVASESLFRLWISRGFIKPIPHGQVYLFMMAIATVMYLAKKNGFEDDALSSLIKLVVGSEEASQTRKLINSNKTNSNTIAKKHDNAIETKQASQTITEVMNKCDTDKHMVGCSDTCCPKSPTGELINYYVNYDRLDTIPKTNNTDKNTNSSYQMGLISRGREFIIHGKHRLCPHEHQSCFMYSVKASLRAFAIGYSAQFAMTLISKSPVLYRNPERALEIVSKNLTGRSLKLAAFLASFSGLFKSFSCASRWYTNTWTPSSNFLAGLLAGPALLFCPSPTIASYVLWKSLEALLSEAEREGKLGSQTKDSIVVLIYGLSTNQLFYNALMNPTYMKKSYMAFLDRMSRHRLHLVNRSVLDVFGTQASAGYEDFYPDLHPSFMSDAFIGSIWIWMIEQKFPVTPVLIDESIK